MSSISFVVVDCGVLDDPANGIVAVFDTTFNSTANYSCNAGYTLRGVAMRTCIASGLWSGSEPKCTGRNYIYHLLLFPAHTTKHV